MNLHKRLWHAITWERQQGMFEPRPEDGWVVVMHPEDQYRWLRARGSIDSLLLRDNAYGFPVVIDKRIPLGQPVLRRDIPLPDPDDPYRPLVDIVRAAVAQQQEETK